MGCVSSKLAAADLRQERKLLCGAGTGGGAGAVSSASEFPNHVVSLTSSTYGVLKLDREDAEEETASSQKHCGVSLPSLLVPPVSGKLVVPRAMEEPLEVINAWELMEDLDDEIPMYSPVKKTTPKHSTRKKLSEGVLESPTCRHKAGGNKENLRGTGAMETAAIDHTRALRSLASLHNQQIATPVTTVRFKSTPANLKIQASAPGRNQLFSEPRKGFSPGFRLFDPDLLASFDKSSDLGEQEQIKVMVSSAPRTLKTSSDPATSLLESFGKCCPPGGEDAVILYTTTLRGIRRTFEECNAVRAAVEAHGVQITERDVSMDAGFREELRKLLAGSKKGGRVPVLFVRGRLVGGAEEVLKLEEEGKLGAMLSGIPQAAPWCDGCGGIRFVLCLDCSGSRKLFDPVEKKASRCGECNENGIIHCPICC